MTRFFQRIALLFLLLFQGGLYAQTIDSTFNPTDLGFGFGDGADNTIFSFAVQSDGKILIVGSFLKYNSTPRNRIARLNADGTLDTSFDPGSGATSTVRTIALQPDGKILIGGDFTTYNGTARNRIARLNADGSLDTSFDPGTAANGNVNELVLQSDGKILIGGQFTNYNGTGRNYIARLNADGSLDTSFDPGAGANDLLQTLALQSDGKILIGGNFTTYNGTARKFLARLNVDGSLDTSFDPGSGATGGVTGFGIQSDGKILIGGAFTSYNGTARNYIARLNADGSLDTSFNPGPGSGASYSVETFAFKSDGKILIGGLFVTYNSSARNYIAQLNADGSLDTSFDPGKGASSTVYNVTILPDGKILIGGNFSTYNNTWQARIARLNADGTVDTGFNRGTGANGAVTALALQSDGKVLIGGEFISYNGTKRDRIARLNADGSVDSSFDPGSGVTSKINTIALQSDSKILIGGDFTTYNGTARNYIARLKADGSLDSSFTPGSGANNKIFGLALQSDGKILIGGQFTSYNGTTRNRIARLNTDGSLDTLFNPGTGASGNVNALALQSDGKILIGGGFTSYNGTTRNRIARLNADGSLDTLFNPGTGASGSVLTFAIQSDGKILITGGFSTYNGTTRNRSARLNADGSLDTLFNPGTGANNTITNLAIQPSDGKIVIVGNFTSYKGTTRNRIARLNADGSLDTSFDPGSGVGSTPGVDPIIALAIQSDDKILIGGNFLSYKGTGRNRVARIDQPVCINTATAGSSTPTLCINTALTTITHITTVATGIGTATGLPSGVTATWASNTITISGTPTQSGIFNYTIPLTGGCGTVNATGTITVTPDNTVGAASSMPTLCINTALTAITHTTTTATGIGTATGLPAGVTASWVSNTITISGTPTASGTFNYIIPLTGGCSSVNAMGTITVIPANTAGAASSTPTLCINTALTAITHTTTGATGIGTATGLPAGVTASWASNTITISGTPTAAGTFNYTIPLTGGCGSINATGTITVVLANTTSTASSTPTLCINTPLTAITHSTTVATGIGTPTGLPTGVTASWASNTITISGTPTQSGTFNYTIPLTGGCGTVNATGIITVTPGNTVGAASSTPTLCINTTLTAITHTTTGATGIGTASGLPAGVTASWASNTITISGTPTVAGPFNYTIPLTGGCGSVNATGTITVTPANTAGTGSSAPTLCINTALTAITHTTTGATGIGTATGLPAGVTASWASNTITISGTPTAAGPFNYSIPLTGGCGMVSATGTITVTPNNTVGTASSTPTLCINTALTAITHTTTTATGIGTATGLPAGVTAAWGSNTITISGTPTEAGTFNYTIPLTGGCSSVNATGTITVTPDNTVGAASSTPTLCINTALTAITHTTTGATGIGTATGLPAGVTASWASNTITISGTPTAAGPFNYTIPLTGGCGSINATGTITVVLANTTSTASSTPTLCINTPLTSITHSTTVATGIGTPTGFPTGVTASWASNTITISGTPTQSGTFNYTIPLTGGCGTVNATGTITVTPDNTVGAASSTPTLCINTALTAITHTTTGATGIGTASGLPAGVTASWASNTITISGTPTVAGTFNYTIPLTGGCGSINATGTITVNQNTASAASSAPTLCINTALTAITHTTTGATGIGTATGLPAGVTASWASNTITISGTPTASGPFNYTIPLTGGCDAVNATGTITVTPDNTVGTASSTPTLCINTALTAITHTTTTATGIGTATGLPAGVTAAWASNTITISGTPLSPGTFNYTIPLTGGCGVASATGTITVINFAPNPDFNATFVNVPLNTGSVATNDVVSPGTTYGPAVANMANPTGATLNLQSNGQYTFQSTASGQFVYGVQVTGTNGCMQQIGLTITVAGTSEGEVNAPVANADIAGAKGTNPVVLRTLTNDAARGYDVSLVPASVALVMPPQGAQGTATVNSTTGDITFTPASGYVGTAEYSYRVCDNRAVPLCDTGIQRVTVLPPDGPNTTFASDDYRQGVAGIPFSGNVLENDSDPENDNFTVQPLDVTVQGVGRLDLRNNPYPSTRLYDPRATARMGMAANGTYTFYPAPGFAGPVSFEYQLCDNGMPQACMSATLYLLVAPASTTDCGCGQNITVTLDTACQFVLRPGAVSPGGCPGSTVRVMDTNPLNGDTIDCPGVWTYGLFNSAGTLICWGKVTAEDKRGPELLAWNGRCNSAGNAGAAPANGSAITPPFLDPSLVRRDTFLCMDIDQIYNVSASWTNSGYAYFAGAPTFQDGCHNRRITSTTSGLSSGNTVLCDCRTDVKVNDQITYYPCPLPTTVGWTGVWAQITRVFTATDCKGNKTTTTQTITFVRPPVTSLAAQVAAAGGSFRSVIGDGSKTRVFLDGGIAAPSPRLMVIMDSTTCASETDAELVRRLRSWYYIFNDTLKCDNADRDDYAYFAEGASTSPRRPLLQCNYSFDSQITSSYPVCDGNGKKVVVMTNYFDWCTGVKLPLDTITIKDYDNLPPVMTNTAKEQVVISTGPLDCTASFGIDRASLLQYFGIDVQDNAGGCGIRDVSVKVESCVDSVAHGIIVDGRAWRSPEYQTVLTGGRRLVLGVPVGMHRLIVDATDMCYSQKRDTFYFRVEDKIAPVVKCTNQLNVTLSNTMGGAYGQSFTQVGTNIYGYARVLASQINAGTTDNCGLEWVRVRRALPANGTLGLTSYYESLKNDPRFVDTAPIGQINKGDGYDWNGNGVVDFGVVEQFRDTILPLQSSTSSMSPAIMTPLLDWVDFFCSDYDQNVMIELWAKDVTRTLTTCGSTPGTMTSGGNLNYCWMNVLIEDKVAPTFIRPWDVTAVCLDRAWLDTLALALSVGTLQLEVDNLSGAITSRTAGSNHAALYNYIERQILSKTANNENVTSYISGVSGKNNVANNKFTRLSGGDCGRIRLDVVVARPSWHCDAGQYTLTFRPQKLVKDVWQTYDGPTSWPNTLLGGGNVTTITVEPVHAYDLRFPADVTGDCSNLRDTANVVDGGELGCDVLAVLVQDKRYNGATKDGAPVAECYKIFRTFTVVNWCQYDERCLEPMGDAVIVPRTATGGAVTVTVRDANRNKEEEYTYNGDAYTPARANGNTSPSCAGSTSSVSNYKGRNNGPEFYSWMYTQYIFVHDAIAPTLATTAPAGGWVGYQNKQTCGGEIKLTFSSTDACSATELQSATSVAIERIWLNPNQNKNARVNVPNAQISPALSTLDGDNKTTQPTQNWTFEVTSAHTAFSQALIPGQHSLTVVVRDDCGNLSRELDIPFTIRDTNGTAPLCINGLSTNLMLNPQTGKNEVTIWATDFKAPSEVFDCNGQGANGTTFDQNKKMITNANYFVYMDTDPATAGFQNAAIGADGRPNTATSYPTSITITCDQLAAFTGNPPSGTRSVLVRVYTRDNASQYAGNTDNWTWCETFVSLDNATVCGGGTSTSAAIAGAVTTETNVKVEGVEVQLSGRSAMRYATDKQGSFSFNSLEKGYDYTVTPQLDKDYLNGVSTFDLVLISKHILGQASLNSPYKLIAADVNNSKTITTLDLVQLRRLVLGIDTKLSSNTSWRFVDATHKFADPSNPWATQFPEVVNVNDLGVDVRANFIAVKVGDVNGNAVASASARTAGTFNLNVDDQQLKAGNEYRVAIAGDLSSIEGMQFTMNYNNKVVELVNIEYGVAKEEHFGIFAKEGVITASWNGNASNGVIATLVFRATTDANLSEVLNLNSRYTAAEAYGRGGEQLGVALNFAGAQSKVAGFELKQNTPNPFVGETVIGFNLPVSGEATLTISDIQGKILRVIRGQYNEGYNQVVLKSEALPTGVLQYTLTSGAFTATRKMVVGK